MLSVTADRERVPRYPRYLYLPITHIHINGYMLELWPLMLYTCKLGNRTSLVILRLNISTCRCTNFTMVRSDGLVAVAGMLNMLDDQIYKSVDFCRES